MCVMNRFTKTSVHNNTQTTHTIQSFSTAIYLKNTLQFTSCNCSFLFSKYEIKVVLWTFVSSLMQQ